jgi:hypothetical protein
MNNETEYHIVRQTVEKVLDFVKLEVEKVEQVINANAQLTVHDMHQMFINIQNHVDEHVMPN